jgi:hypothetical protein
MAVYYSSATEYLPHGHHLHPQSDVGFNGRPSTTLETQVQSANGPVFNANNSSSNDAAFGTKNMLTGKALVDAYSKRSANLIKKVSNYST